MPEILIGLVSHSASRFAWNQSDQGLAQTLARGLHERGIEAEVRINTENFFDPQSLALTPRLAHESAVSVLRVELAWQRFLRVGTAPGRRLSGYSAMQYAARRMRQAWKFRAPRALGGSTPDSQITGLRRLLNIELSHLDVMEAGVNSGAEWTLILEDDASTLNSDDAVSGLLGIMHSSYEITPAYVNVSESFTAEELDVRTLLMSPRSAWAGTVERSIFPSQLPITNTVCAVLYHREFLKSLLGYLRALPQVPVIPIDWKLNQALMAMATDEVMSPGECWTVFPGPFDQLSMRDASEIAERSR